MTTQDDVRRIALALPGVSESHDDFAFSVEVKGKAKGMAWSWKERVVPKKPRVPNFGVLAIRVANLGQKDLILSSKPKQFVHDPHYDGYPAVLVRLDAVSVADLEMLLTDAWRNLTTPPARKR